MQANFQTGKGSIWSNLERLQLDLHKLNLQLPSNFATLFFPN